MQNSSSYINLGFNKNKIGGIILSTFVITLLLFGCSSSNHQKISPQEDERTVFQTARPWKPTTDVRADVAIVYGADDYSNISFEERVQSWRDRGYTTHFMTGIAWGGYVDYFTGEWDGEWHLDEGQVQQNGDTIWHGHMVPYIVPTDNYIKYIKDMHIKRVIDAGIDAIYLEEPEFWARAGYSESFKREWEKYYGFVWRAPHTSAENTYLSNKLKYQLYYNALEDVFNYAKEYGKSKGMNVRCYVPTHSLVNYSQWQIISPEASLASLESMDGYIAQVWTGTAREPNYYNGLAKERVFETAFLEYGSMESMTAPTGRKMFFLTDPIEDWPRDWVDYKRNYEATFTAQLLYPQIADYEVMPWPDRIYEGLYKKSADSDERANIPRFYSTQMQVMINSLNHMPLSENKVSGSEGVSVLMANSLMFQRFPTHEGYEDPQLSNFYGQALPFLKRGVPVNIVHLENTSYPESLINTKVLLMTYSNMKPLSPEPHKYIAEWVKQGGVLVYSGRDEDPFQTVQEWWNIGDNSYDAPSQHLFEMMGISSSPEVGTYNYGKGAVYVIRKDPKEFVLEASNDSTYFATVQEAYEITSKDKLIKKNNFFLARDPYIIAAVMDESVTDEPLILKGLYIDLFDHELPVLQSKIIHPGEQAYLYDVSTIKNKKRPAVLCGASRIYQEVREKGKYSFVAKSPINTTNVSRVYVPQKPKKIMINQSSSDFSWDDYTKTCLIKFENHPDGIGVLIEY